MWEQFIRERPLMIIVQPLNGASPKLNLKEISVQGTQIKVVTAALIAKGVPKRWIKEEEGKKK